MARSFVSLLFVWFLIPHQNTRAQTVSIGAITNPTTRIGREQKVAIELAIEKFSPEILLAGGFDLNTTDLSPAYSYVQSLIQLGANIIITTGTSQQVLISGTTASEAKIPIISLLPSPFITGPFTFKIIYPEDAFVLCIADFVKLHGWPKVITIYENDSLGLVSGTNLLLKDALKNVGSSLEYHVAFQPHNYKSDLDNTVETEFRQMMQYESTVYIVLHISENLALSLFKKAKELNLTSPRYVWVCGNDISDLLNSTLSPTFIAKNIDHSAEYKIFYSKFQKKFASDYGNSNGSFFNPGVYAVRAYDAVHAISQSSIESKVKNITLVEALSMVTFVGLSGTIELENNTITNNKMKILNYQIFGIIGETRETLGFWYEDSGFNTGMKNLSWLHELISNHNVTKPSALRMLRVAIPAKPFWKNFVKVKEHSTINCSAVVDPSSVTGFCIDVFTNALKFLKYNVSYQFVAYTTEVDSSCTVRTYNDLANLVHSQEVDLVVGDVTITINRAKNVSFSQPFLTSELVMLVLKESTGTGWLSIKPFSRDLWICITGILFCFIILVWLLERNDQRADSDFHGPIWMQLAASVWLLCNSVFLKIDEGVGSYHTKIVLLWWFLVVQVLLSSFTASFSSILVQEMLYPKVDNLKIGYNAQSFVYDYLQSTFNYGPEKFVKIEKRDEFSMAFKNRTINAAYLELPYLRIFLEEEGQHYATYGESRTLGGFGFVFQKRSPLRDDFSSAILKLQEDGTITQLQSKWFRVSSSQKKKNKQSTLGLDNFAYLFIFATCFATLTTLHKFVYNWWMDRTNHEATN